MILQVPTSQGVLALSSGVQNLDIACQLVSNMCWLWGWWRGVALLVGGSVAVTCGCSKAQPLASSGAGPHHVICSWGNACARYVEGKMVIYGRTVRCRVRLAAPASSLERNRRSLPWRAPETRLLPWCPHHHYHGLVLNTAFLLIINTNLYSTYTV